MTREDIEQSVTFVGKLLATLGAIGGMFLVVVPRCRRLIAAYFAAADLAAVFGRDAGVVLKRLLVAQGQTLSQTQAMIEATSRAIHLGVYCCDENGRCISVNTVLEQWFGVPRDRCMGYGWLSAIVDREKAFAQWKFAVDNGIPYRDNYIIENVESKERFVATTEAVKIEVEGGSVYIGFVRLTEESA